MGHIQPVLVQIQSEPIMLCCWAKTVIFWLNFGAKTIVFGQNAIVFGVNIAVLGSNTAVFQHIQLSFEKYGRI